MNKKKKIRLLNIAYGLFAFWLIAGIICFSVFAAVDHDPWDGTAWDVTAPNIDQPIGDHYKEMYDLRKGVAIRINKEHETLATSSAGGVHKQGSARMWYLATASIPQLQVDGSTAMDSGDNGMLWHDTTTDIIYALDDYADPNIGTGWISTGMYLGNVDVGASKLTVAVATGNTAIAGTLGVTGASTFTAGITCNGGVTLGAGDDLIGSSTSDITINTNKFTVAGDTGNTSVGGTLGVTGATTATGLITANGGVTIATTKNLVGGADTDILMNTDKFTVAGATGNTVVAGTLSVTGASTLTGGIFGTWTKYNSGGVLLALAGVYKATSDGFVTVYDSDSDNTIDGYTDANNPPTTIRVKSYSGTTKGAGFSMPVKKDHYWELNCTSAINHIWWLPIGSGECQLQ